MGVILFLNVRDAQCWLWICLPNFNFHSCLEGCHYLHVPHQQLWENWEFLMRVILDITYVFHMWFKIFLPNFNFVARLKTYQESFLIIDIGNIDGVWWRLWGWRSSLTVGMSIIVASKRILWDHSSLLLYANPNIGLAF